MKTLSALCGLISALLLLILGITDSSAELITSWQFNGDFSNSTGGAALTVNGAQPVTFSTLTIAGSSAQVANVPAFSNSANNISAVNPIGVNGGGASRTNDYTMIMDVNVPSNGVWQSLLQTNTTNSDDVDWGWGGSNNMYVSQSLVGGSYSLPTNTWHRLVMRNTASGTISTQIFLDGSPMGSPVTSALDSTTSLGASFFLFSDENGQTANFLVNSVALYDSALSDAEILSLGGATATGIAIAIPEPSCALLSLVGIAAMGLRRRRRSFAPPQSR